MELKKLNQTKRSFHSSFFSLFIFILAGIFLLGGNLVAQVDTGAVDNRLKKVEKLIDPAVTKWEYSQRGKVWNRRLLRVSVERTRFFFRTVLRGKSVFAGTRVKGTPLYLSVRFYLKGVCHVNVSVNGKQVDKFVLDGPPGSGKTFKKEILISKSAGTGRYKVIFEIENKGFKPFRTEFWPPRERPLGEDGQSLRINGAKMIYPEAEPMLAETRNWLQSMQTGKKLLFPDFRRFTFTRKPFDIEDKRKTPKERLKTLSAEFFKAVMAFDVKALQRGNAEQVKQSIKTSYDLAKNVAQYAKEFKVHLIGNAHIDIAWLWRIAETVMVAHNTYDTVLKNQQEYPELHYAQSQALTYDWIETKFPDLFAGIKKAFKEGRWEIVGGMWVEPDCNLISGESWVRQILYGKNYFKEKFGHDVKIGWNVDSFGYNWNMPQFYRKSGIDMFVTQKIWWNDTTVFPYYVFWWEGVDGTRLLSYFPPVGYTSRVKLDNISDNITKYEATTGHKKSLVLYGIGDHGGGPNREILNRVRDYGKLAIAPEFIHSKADDFLKNVETELKDNIPVWKDELYLEYHRGTFTTQAAIKKGNRRSEAGLSTAEKAASLASLACSGFVYPQKPLETTWKQVLTNQFHDILPGSHIPAVCRDAVELYDEAGKTISWVTKKSLKHLAKAADTRFAAKNFKGKTAIPILVFNSLSWQRDDMVSVVLKNATGKNWIIIDSLGRVEPAEVTEDKNNDEVRITFLAHQVPSVGYKIYAAVKGKGVQAMFPDLPGNDATIENDFFKIEVDKTSGNIKSLYWKLKRRELVPGGGETNILQIYEDRPEKWDAWNIGYTGRMWELNKADSVKIVKRSPARVVLEVKKSFLGINKTRYSPTENFPSSFFTQYITLYKDLKRIDFRTEADWWESHMFLKAALPLDIYSDTAAYEIPYAAIKRTTKSETLEQKARFEVPALRWADLSDGMTGVSLMNDCKYGYDIHGNVMKLSLLRSPEWPDKMADRGKHTFTYSLYIHDRHWNDAETVKQARQLNCPLQTVVTDIHKGVLPDYLSLARLNANGIVLDTVKKSEDGSGFIFRFYEAHGRDEQATVTFFKPPKAVTETNLMEQPVEGQNIPVNGAKIKLSFKRFEIKTLHVKFAAN